MLAPFGAGLSTGFGPAPRNSFDFSDISSLNITVRLVKRPLRYFFSALGSGFGSFPPPAGSSINPWEHFPVSSSTFYTYQTKAPTLLRHGKCCITAVKLRKTINYIKIIKS